MPRRFGRSIADLVARCQQWFAEWPDQMAEYWQPSGEPAENPQTCHVSTLVIPVEEVRKYVAEQPKIAQYEALAAVWSQYGADFTPDYMPYIKALSRRYRMKRDIAADIACGTGRVTEQLLDHFSHVHCVDRSPHMLVGLQEQLREWRGLFTIHEASFADFTLPVEVSFAVCAGDSINYIASMAELVAVFRSVARCLRPGGFFLFDVIADPPDWLPEGHATVHRIDGHANGPFETCLCYDTEAGTSECYCICSRGVEHHRRLLISREDITQAAEEAGLWIEDIFPNEDRLYGILRRPPSP